MQVCKLFFRNIKRYLRSKNDRQKNQHTKRSVEKILPLFPIPKISPNLAKTERGTKKYALLGEINSENINPKG